MYFWSPFYFLWAEVALSVLFLICAELFSITFNLHIVEKYGKDVFERLQEDYIPSEDTEEEEEKLW